METNPSWIESKQVCGQVCIPSDTVFQIDDFALQGSLSGTGSLCLVGSLAGLYLHFYATISVVVLQHYGRAVVGFYFSFKLKSVKQQSESTSIWLVG